jgi:glucose/arabinose dehydrogenase
MYFISKTDIMKQQLLLLCFLGFLEVQAQVGLPGGFAQQMLADSLNPTAMAFDHHGNLFLAQKDGRVLLLRENDLLQADPVLQIPVDDFNERGLSGIALHPDFDNQPWLYVYYTVRDSNYNRISRFRINGNFAVPGSEQVLYNCDPLAGNIHNAGAMAFGPDGRLYIATGEGAKATNSQSLASDLGKILRLNTDGSIPQNNPFSGLLKGKYRSIFATGMRNPFTLDIQQSTGRIFASDVGQGGYEEINEVFPGKNYGWNLIEGPITNQTPPADYQDPLYYYAHTDGCAIIGSTVYDPPQSVFPKEYRGKIFFADYCKGNMRALDPATGSVAFEFATGLKQPVGISVKQDGSLYYLMRSGLGTGSVIDNTSTYNGTLWKVFYTGSGKPFISLEPQDAALPVGEDATFEVQVLGSQPFDFQWYRNEEPVAGAKDVILNIKNIALQDDGSRFYCVVKNAEGADTSKVAVLHVLNNQRPVPRITSPPENFTYKAGDNIEFNGLATDLEDGTLDATHLQWRIDAHHDTHTHPGLDPVTGISGGTFAVPVAGETSPNTWYRIYLSATDNTGLSRTIYRDVFPDLVSIQVEGPLGLPVNVDGVQRPLPYMFESLKRQERTISALDQWMQKDTLYLFEKWQGSADASPIFKFNAPDTTGLNLKVQYSAHPLGNGTGLHGEYFIDPEFDLDEEPTVLRRDSVINFEWGNGSPFPNQIPANGFTIRWSGFVQPVFSEEYTFFVRSDDGCRLYINDSLIIDKWVPQPTIEHQGSIRLKAGKKYTIRLEYLEIGGGANISFFWASPRTTKTLVPQRQLYLPNPYAPSTIKGRVWRDDNYNQAADISEPPLPGTTILLYDGQDSSLLDVQVTNVFGEYKFINLTSGPYFMRAVTDASNAHLLPYAYLNASAQSQVLAPEPLQALQYDMAFILKPAAIRGQCWHDVNYDTQRQVGEPALKDITVLLFNGEDSLLLKAQNTDQLGNFSFDFLPAGNYFLQFSNALNAQNLIPGKGLNAQGLTSLIPF